MRISDWSSDVCSSDLIMGRPGPRKRRLQRSMDAVGEAGSGVIVMLMRPLPGSADAEAAPAPAGGMDLRTYGIGAQIDRKSVVSGKSVSVRVDLGGRRIIKKKKNVQT